MEITRDISIDINELYLLDGTLLSGIWHKPIEEYFKKSTHRSKTSEYREGSVKYNEAVIEDEKIALIPDHDIKSLYHSLIITCSSYETVKFDIMRHKYISYSYDEYNEERYEVEVTKYFLTDNSYHGFSIYGDVRDLLNDRAVSNLLFKSQRYDMEQKWYKTLQEMGEGYTLLYKKVLDAVSSFKSVQFYSQYVDASYKRYADCVVIDKEIYLLSELNTILEFKNSNAKLYDENDRVVSIYSNDDYIDAYKKYFK